MKRVLRISLLMTQLIACDYNYFLDAGGFVPKPVRVRVTAVDGHTIEDELPAVQEYLEVEGTSQFQ
jgi:expansin (peptidoglycan-binding protein)